MGYRCRVRIIMPKENFDYLKSNCPKNIDYMFGGTYEFEGIDKKKYTEKNPCDYVEREVTLSTENGEKEQAVIFGWNWIKLYSGYEDVDYIENYVDNLREKDIPCKVVIMGEDGASEEYYSDCLDDDKDYYNVIYADYGIAEEV